MSKRPSASSSTSTPTRASTSSDVQAGRHRHPRQASAQSGLESFPWSPAARASTSSRRCAASTEWPRGQGLLPRLRRRSSRATSPSASPPTSARPSARAGCSSTISATSAARPRSPPSRRAPARAAPWPYPIAWDEVDDPRPRQRLLRSRRGGAGAGQEGPLAGLLQAQPVDHQGNAEGCRCRGLGRTACA